MRLMPQITGIDLSMLQTKGANLLMFDFVIANNATTLYNGIKRGEILTALRPALATRVNTHPLPLTYDVHGDKHFPGGPPGTKFTDTKAVINPLLVAMITPHTGRIRRDANGKNQTYYLSMPQQPYTALNGPELAIQVDYLAGPPDSITYHGYPRDVHAFVLSRTLGGLPIPV